MRSGRSDRLGRDFSHTPIAKIASAIAKPLKRREMLNDCCTLHSAPFNRESPISQLKDGVSPFFPVWTPVTAD